MWRKQFTVGRTRTREKGGKTRTATHTSKEESESEREKETKQIISSPVRLSFPSRRRFLFFRPKRRYETFGPERHSQTTQGESTLAVVSRPRRGICRSFFSFLFSSLLFSSQPSTSKFFSLLYLHFSPKSLLLSFPLQYI